MWWSVQMSDHAPDGESLEDFVSRISDVLRFVFAQQRDDIVVFAGEDGANRELLPQLERPQALRLRRRPRRATALARSSAAARASAASTRSSSLRSNNANARAPSACSGRRRLPATAAGRTARARVGYFPLPTKS